ncbi:hypothetical protein DL764_006266 [Monosporascus ibericus]|uniref:Uncharacterized protein n=1 Tax=Monosporascus ibericus TaxID=155417 RepID=A0A4Q4T588_9PEZI|nr:hypothetical protein DL764_006266 [Monosporascus ibericus]
MFFAHSEGPVIETGPESPERPEVPSRLGTPRCGRRTPSSSPGATGTPTAMAVTPTSGPPRAEPAPRPPTTMTASGGPTTPKEEEEEGENTGPALLVSAGGPETLALVAALAAGVVVAVVAWSLNLLPDDQWKPSPEASIHRSGGEGPLSVVAATDLVRPGELRAPDAPAEPVQQKAGPLHAVEDVPDREPGVGDDLDAAQDDGGPAGAAEQVQAWTNVVTMLMTSTTVG